MSRKKLVLLMLCALALFVAAACSSEDDPVSSDTEQGDDSGDDNDDDVENVGDHEDMSDYTWDESEVMTITLDGTSITASTSNVTIDGSTVTITAAGTYSLSGTLNDGQVIVDTDDDGIVRLILNGVNITCQASAPVFVKSADKTVVILADATANTLTDGSSYVYEDPDEDEPNAAVFSKDDLTVYGSGTLTVNANYNDGITSKDGLIIRGASINVNAADDGIRGKDYLVVRSGTISVNCSGDGFKSDNDEDDGKGYVAIDSGTVAINSTGDGIDAAKDVEIAYAVLSITSGGGSNHSISDDASAKGIKSDVSIIIVDGIITVNSADDAIHTDGDLTINGGDFSISSADDGIHADYDLEINGGEIQIKKSYEGIESADGNITINGGEIHVSSSDDGINVAAGGETMGAPATAAYLYINGGYIVVVASGDGIDSNGGIVMTDGVLLVHGPTSDGNGAIDYNMSFKMTGGLFVAAGSAGMAQTASGTSTQCALLATSRTTLQAGTLFHIQTSGGEDVLTFKPVKYYRSVAFSSPDLQKGSSYSIYVSGSCDGTETDGLYEGGTYTPGTSWSSFTISNTVTSISR